MGRIIKKLKLKGYNVVGRKVVAKRDGMKNRIEFGLIKIIKPVKPLDCKSNGFICDCQ